MSALTVIVPTFNEAENVELLVSQLNAHLDGVDAEILFVDDSTDNTTTQITAVAADSAVPVRLLHREVPEGRLAGAVVAGIEAAASPWVIVMDGDLQHPPSAVPALYRQALLGTSDVVVASRYAEGGTAGGLENRFRRLVSTWSGRSAKALFPRRLAGCSDPMSGFFAVRRDAVRLDQVTRCGYKILLALLVHRRLAVSEVPFTFGERNAGQSKASLREGLRYLRLLALLRSGPGLLFALVGASGVLPNLAVFAILTRVGTPYLVAAAVATQVAILWNLAGAELIVFRDRRVGRLGSRAVRFIAVSETDLLRLPFVAILVEGSKVNSFLATLLTLLVAVALRYALASRVIYRAPVAAPAASAAPNTSS